MHKLRETIRIVKTCAAYVQLLKIEFKMKLCRKFYRLQKLERGQIRLGEE